MKGINFLAVFQTVYEKRLQLVWCRVQQRHLQSLLVAFRLYG